MSANATARPSVHHLLLQVGNVNNVCPSSAIIPLSTGLKIVEGARRKVLLERTRMGYHAEESDHRRREKFEISQAKIYALDLVEDALLSAAVESAASFSGSAGTQPLTSEESPGSMGTTPVTIPAANPRPWATMAEAFPSGGVADWLDSLPIADVEAISEAALSSLEARGAVVHWSLTGA